MLEEYHEKTDHVLLLAVGLVLISFSLSLSLSLSSISNPANADAGSPGELLIANSFWLS
jgi:hypothetical protein